MSESSAKRQRQRQRCVVFETPFVSKTLLSSKTHYCCRLQYLSIVVVMQLSSSSAKCCFRHWRLISTIVGTAPSSPARLKSEGKNAQRK